LGWFLNKNINFNKPRRPCPLGCWSQRAGKKTGITNLLNGLLGLQMPKDASEYIPKIRVKYIFVLKLLFIFMILLFYF